MNLDTGNIDSALDLVQEIQERTTHDGGDIMHLSYSKAVSLILSRDDDIRRECAEAVEELKNTCLMHFPTPYEEGVFDGYQNAIDAIISLVKE
jgi:hypothetical protein